MTIPSKLVCHRSPTIARALLMSVGFLILLGNQCAFAQRLALGASTQAVPVLADAATRIGIKQCLPAITEISRRASAGSQRQDVLLDWDHSAPDAAPFFSLTGIEYRESAAALSLTTVPDATGGCAILVERISNAPVSCKNVALTQLAGYRASPLVNSITVYTTPSSPRETVTLVDTPPACLIIRRQVQYGWRG